MPRFAIVTGANAPSLGFRAAQLLAGEPHRFRVVLACRSESRGRAAQREIEAADPGAWVRFMKCDLASLASVRAFAQDLRSIEGGAVQAAGLSLLVANAGVGFGRDRERRLTDDGFELRLGVNHLGHFLLVNLLLPELRAAPSARVVVVSSELHAKNVAGESSLLDLDDLQLEKPGAYEVCGKAQLTSTTPHSPEPSVFTVSLQSMGHGLYSETRAVTGMLSML